MSETESRSATPGRPARGRRILFGALALALGAALAIGLLELALRAAPGILRPSLGNHVYSKYNTLPGGIYFHEPVTSMFFLHSDFETTAYWNGYRWRHRTDDYGFRNPPGLEDRSILLLGDSLIYGHGVDEEQTTAHYLREDFDRPVYNMARQGDSIYQHYVLLRLYLERFAPHTALLFVFGNDVHDLLSTRPAAAIEDPPELGRYDYADIYDRLDELDAAPPSGPRLLVSRLIDGLGREIQRPSWRRFWKGLFGELPPAPDPASRPQLSTRTILKTKQLDRAARYYRRTLSDLAARARERDVRLELVLLDIGPILGAKAEKAQRKLGRRLRHLARELEIGYSTTEGLWDRCEQCFLPNDGHLTADGHRLLAEFVDRRVLGSGPVRAPGAGRARRR